MHNSVIIILYFKVMHVKFKMFTVGKTPSVSTVGSCKKKAVSSGVLSQASQVVIYSVMSVWLSGGKDSFKKL